MMDFTLIVIILPEHIAVDSVMGADHCAGKRFEMMNFVFKITNSAFKMMKSGLK